jgi:hypothetical protein
MNKNEVKKELIKNKSVAIFDHYTSGNLYFNVEVLGKKYQFPISVFETDGETLSHDLGTTSFDEQIKASYLNRWVDKAIDNGTFIDLTSN